MRPTLGQDRFAAIKAKVEAARALHESQEDYTDEGMATKPFDINDYRTSED